MRRIGTALLAFGCSWIAGAHAQDAAGEQPGPDLDFLEYLGAWAAEDDEWLAIEEWERDNGAEPEQDSADEDSSSSEPRPEGDDDEND